MAAAGEPRPLLVSAVLCTCDRASALERTLESLAEQTLSRDALEVVVVDDGSVDRTRDVARAFESRLPLRYSHQRRSGLASARNHGLFLARGHVVLFLDDDAAEPRLLEEHLEAHRRFPEPWFAVMGRVRLDPAIAADPLMRFVVDASAAHDPRGAAFEVLDPRSFRAGRSSCKRSFLVDHGVFNPAFRFGGEDAELAYRLSSHGFRVVHAGRAVTVLTRGATVDDECLELRRRGEADFLASRIHGAQAAVGWTDPAEAAAQWRELGPAYDSIVRSARELDHLVRVRQQEGLPVGAAELSLLHRSYRAAFHASRVRGIVEKASSQAPERRRLDARCGIP
jgi:glycosyltransferase involved in cell wall biosynthesis